MSITEELREIIPEIDFATNRDRLRAIADLIDMKHELGRGTCKDSNKRFNAWVCSECGATVMMMFDDYGEPSYSVDGVADVPRYCPNCGRRVVAGDES